MPPVGTGWAANRPARSPDVPESRDRSAVMTMLLPIQYRTGHEQSTVYSSSAYAFEPMVNAFCPVPEPACCSTDPRELPRRFCRIHSSSRHERGSPGRSRSKTRTSTMFSTTMTDARGALID
jgi:hypothetical protein